MVTHMTKGALDFFNGLSCKASRRETTTDAEGSLSKRRWGWVAGKGSLSRISERGIDVGRHGRKVLDFVGLVTLRLIYMGCRKGRWIGSGMIVKTF